VLECFTLTVECVSLAEQYRTPTILLMDEIVGHMRESVALPAPGSYSVASRPTPEEGLPGYCPFEECESGVSPLAAFGGEYRFHITGLTHDRQGFPTMVGEEVDRKIRWIVDKIETQADELASYEEFMVDDCDTLLFAYGSTARVAKSSVRALRDEGVKAGLLRTRTIWPFSTKRLRELAERVRLVVVPEMNVGQLVLEVERAVCGEAPVRALGRVDGHLFEPEEISEFVQKEIGR
jgi:2-oxoglutarate ferredoxin oxidoreductase subunit alpha